MGRSCCSALCLGLPCPPRNLSSSRRRLCLRPQTQILGRLKGHGLLMLKRHRLHRPTVALLSQASIQELSNNQVLVAVVTASLIGQVLKPFTAALQGKGFNWRLVLASGGMPSSHSACVTAACTSIALERGLADSLFGLSVVFAGIVMYDAQGVRRAVGKQAEVINTMMVGSDIKPMVDTYKLQSFPPTNRRAEMQSAEEFFTPDVSSSQRSSTTMATANDEQQRSSENSQYMDKLFRGGSFNRTQSFIETAKKLPSVEAGEVNLQEIGDMDGWRHIPLKESVGHTKLEVFVGGLWGIISTLGLSYFTEIALSQTTHS